MVRRRDPDPEHERLLAIAMQFCRKKGYPVDDPEYGSAVGWGVCRALSSWKQQKATLKTWCCRLALNECFDAAKQMRHWEVLDRIGAEIGPRYQGEPEIPKTPLEMGDFEILLFVARFGKTRAAKLLGMHNYTMHKLLEIIQLRLER